MDRTTRPLLAALLALAYVPAIAAPDAAVARQVAAKTLGEDATDLVFIPTVPCTVWDTRYATTPAAAGWIANGQTRRFYSHGTHDFRTTGGSPTCVGMTEGELRGRPYAVMMTVYVSDASSEGWLTLYRDGDADPSNETISIYYAPGPLRTQTVIARSSRGYGTGTFDIAATSRHGGVHAAASITGYFIKPFRHGEDNTYIGADAGPTHFNPQPRNTAVGAGSLGTSSAIGTDNVAVGVDAMGNMATGAASNVAIGNYAMANAGGNESVALGTFANKNTISGRNTAIGYNALVNSIAGNNIAIGWKAGSNLLHGFDNIFIGNEGTTTDSRVTRIGGPEPDTARKTFIAGIRGATTTTADAIPVVIDSNGQLGTLSSSRAVKEDIEDIDAASARLMKLRPVTFHYSAQKAAGDLRPQYGLVAEEVAEQMPELVARAKDGTPETVYYQFLPPMLLNEYQKQQRTIEGLQAEVAELRAHAARTARLLDRLEAR